MSYEQKYLKYKQKYMELKNKIEMLEQQGGNDSVVFNLSDTPNLNNMTGGSNFEPLVNDNVEPINDNLEEQMNELLSELNLTETPSQQGGVWVGQGAEFVGLGTGIPYTTNCSGTGSVNPQPDVSLLQTGQQPVAPAAQPNPAPAVMPDAGPVMQPVQPEVQPPIAAEAFSNVSNKNTYTSELDTTTDLTDNNTDIEQIFNQLGGRKKSRRSKSSSESSSESDSADNKVESDPQLDRAMSDMELTDSSFSSDDHSDSSAAISWSDGLGLVKKGYNN